MQSHQLEAKKLLIESVTQDILSKRKSLKKLRHLNNLLESKTLLKKINNLSNEIMYHLKELENIGCIEKNFTIQQAAITQ